MPAGSSKLFMSRITQERQQESGFCFAYGAITLWGRAFQRVLLQNPFFTLLPQSGTPSPYNPHPTCVRQVWASPVSLAATRGISESRSLGPIVGTGTEILVLISFPPGTEMFHFPGFASRTHVRDHSITRAGFPHSDTSGSKLARQLPGTFRRQAASFIAF